MSRIDINPNLTALLDAMMERVKDAETPLIDQCRVADRALKLEAIKKGASASQKGSAFDDDDDFMDDDEPLPPPTPVENPDDQFSADDE